MIFADGGISLVLILNEFNTAKTKIQLKWDSVKGLRAPQSLLFSSRTSLMFGVRDSVTSVPFSNKFNVWSSRFSQRPESSSVVVLHWASLLYGKRDSFTSVPFSNKFNVWSSRFLSRPEFSGLHRNDRLRGWWGVKKGAEAELQHLFLQWFLLFDCHSE